MRCNWFIHDDKNVNDNEAISIVTPKEGGREGSFPWRGINNQRERPGLTFLARVLTNFTHSPINQPHRPITADPSQIPDLTRDKFFDPSQICPLREWTPRDKLRIWPGIKMLTRDKIVGNSG